MPISDTLKLDIRVRERLLRKGQLTEAEVERQDAALLDAEDKVVVLELKQPALQKESERLLDGPRISRPAPAQRPAPIRPFDEEEDEIPLPVAAAAVVDDDEDDEDEDDEDEDEDDAKDKSEPEGGAAKDEHKDKGEAS